MTDRDLLGEATERKERIVGWRRELHAHPELRFDLPWTEGFVAGRLEEMGWGVRTGVARHGVVALLEVPGASGCVALRADMDALPLTEETGLPFAAPGETMHACGHDAHMAMLLGAAELLVRHREDLKVSVKLIFQPDEEGGEGAQAMIREGVLQSPEVEAIFGCHVGCLWPDLPVGQVGVRPGVMLSANDHFRIRLLGRSAHGATPHRGVDAVVLASQVVAALQTLVSREIPAVRPAVVSLGRIQGGSAFNIIPGEVRLEGTFRAVTPEDREFLARRVEELARGVAALHGGEAEVLWEKGAPPVVNHRGFTEAFRRSAGKILPPEDLVDLEAPTLVGEDMALYLERLPGTFFFLGGGEGAPHHHPQFDLDEEVLWRGTALFVRFALDFCSGAEVP